MTVADRHAGVERALLKAEVMGKSKENMSRMTEDAEKAPRPAQMLGVRHVQTLLMFSALLFAYTLRVNLSVAIVAMVDKESANPSYQEFDWDEQTQALLLSSFFWGYVLAQLPSGPLVEKFGAKVMMGQAVFVSSLLACIMPLVADWGGWELLCASRVIQGLSQGCITPCIHTLLANWAPGPERGKMSTWAYAGSIFGTIVTLPVCGVLATSALGWPSTFYVFGACGVAWTVVWIVFGSNGPAEHKSISPEERAYIQDWVGVTQVSREEKPSIPWKAMLTSLPVWAIVAAHCGQYWGFWTLLTEMPSFMKAVLQFDLKANGFLSAVPYLCQWILSFFFGWLSDYINRRQLITLEASRKIFNSIGHWLPALALIGLGYTSAEAPALAVTLLALAVGVNSATYVGFTINHIDLSPNYAGAMIGVTNCAGNMMSIIAPLVVGAIVTDKSNVLQWRTVFFIAAGIYFVANLIFVVFGKAEIQPFNEPQLKTRASSMRRQSQASRKSVNHEEIQ